MTAFLRHLVVTLILVTTARADLAVSPQILAPKTPAEAWNVIRLATDNVARLIQEDRLTEVANQISLCSAALRTLASNYVAPEHSQLLNDSTAQAAAIVNDIARASMADQLPATTAQFAKFRALLDQLKTAFDPGVVGAEIYTCPQHPDEITTDSAKPCPQCQRPQRIRRIPYSDIYASPSKPNATLALQAKSPLSKGIATEVLAQLKTPTGEALKATDLITTHSAGVRLLIVDPSLTDFQSIIPTATASGDWSFPFTPATAGPYRAWASLTPSSTALTEYSSADLGTGFIVVPRTGDSGADTLSASSQGLKFQIAFTGGIGGPPLAKQTQLARIKITDKNDQPITSLQPHHQAFAHLTAIYADGQTILQFHPTGGDVLNDALRAGPLLSFKTYFPKSGYLQLFCQIKLNDQLITVPFGINIKG